MAEDRRTFLQETCFECHSSKSAEGGLNLETLATELTSAANFAIWERVHDRVSAKEMPPKSASSVTEASRSAFLAPLYNDLSQAHSAAKGTVLRRLNRQEFQNTLNDLFGTHVDIVHRLPEDRRSHEFDNIGEALGISQVQMQGYLESIESVLQQAIPAATTPPPSKILRASYADTQGAAQWLGKIWLQRDDGAVVLFKDYGYPTGMLREANVSKEGWYKVRVIGYAYQSELPVTFALGATTFARGVEQPTFGYFELPPGEPSTVEVKVWIPARYMIEVTPWGITDKNNELKQKGAADYTGPGLAIQAIEVEGPITDEYPSRGYKMLFDGIQREEVPPRNPSDRQRSSYVPKFTIRIDANELDSTINTILERIATQAFRHRPKPEQLAPYHDLFREEYRRGASIEEALRTAATAIFCSPDFLFLRESPGMLDDAQLASRLAYFLTRTTPDETLLALAREGKLAGDNASLLRQVERHISDPRFGRFITDFTDAWLNLRDINFTNPDSVLYPEFDPFLQWSMLEETRETFRKMLTENLSVTHIVKSDMAMLNNRLAAHYGIEGVTGPAFRPVKLASNSLRGGLLSQASVLKVSANGTSTSPVVRGVWVMERILGQLAPPPPPGVPGIEPDIRGASTLRELLDKHRQLDTCNGCHQKIDPPGFALESFDPIGGYRERFRSIGNGDRVDELVRGQRVRYKLGPHVDSSGQLAAGQKFSDYREFRDLLASDPHALAKSFATKLLTFATGREMGFSDRAEIDRIVAESEKDNFGMRSILQQVVTSKIFRSK